MSRSRFLADHDLNEHLVRGVLRREPAIEFICVRDIDMHERSDTEVLTYAAEHQRQALTILLVAPIIEPTDSCALQERCIAVRLEDLKHFDPVWQLFPLPRGDVALPIQLHTTRFSEYLLHRTL